LMQDSNELKIRNRKTGRKWEKNRKRREEKSMSTVFNQSSKVVYPVETLKWSKANPNQHTANN